MPWANNTFTAAIRAASLVAMKLTGSREADPEHLLIAQLGDEESPLVKTCRTFRPGFDPQTQRETIVTAVRRSPPQPVPDAWSDSTPSARTRDALAAAQADPDWATADDPRRQRLLTAALLKAAKGMVQRIFTNSGVPCDELQAALRRAPVAVVQPFNAEGAVDLAAFDAAAQAVLRLAETEGKGLGLSRVTAPLLLFAFVARENGPIDRGLRLQARDPRQVHQNLLLHLRSLGKGRFNDALALDRSVMQGTIVRALDRAAGLAQEANQPRIGEPDLFKALLLEDEAFVRSFLTSQKVDVKELAAFVQERRAAEEPAAEEQPKGLTITEVEQRLRDRIVGQGHVVDAIMPFLKRMRFGYARRGRPMGVLMFVGMSGTGKTQLAKEIARAVYGSEDQLVFLEMSQFGSEHSKTIFVGAPPGLVGYGEGLLTNGLRDKPESVVLFDEVEKAHPSVFDVLLRFLDEGMIADPAGPVRNGQKCVLILTSNQMNDRLRELIQQHTQAGAVSATERAATQAAVREALMSALDPSSGRQFFRPEFLNRIDELVLFNSFGRDSYRKILGDLLTAECRRFLAEKRKTIVVDPAVHDLLVEECFTRRDQGARICGKLISTLVVTPLIDFFVQPQNAAVERVRVVLEGGDIAVVKGGGP